MRRLPDPPKLRYDWFGACQRFRDNPDPSLGLTRLNEVHDAAASFIAAHVVQAERARMQPAHLLKPGGLAWRWTDCMALLCFPSARHVVIESLGVSGHALFAYRFEADGGVTFLTGEERGDIISGAIEGLG